MQSSTQSPAATRPPVLWLIGPVGTGKSDASFHLFSRLFRGGTHVARLDLDDIGMSYPVPADDQDNHRVKAAVMAAAWPVYAERGATCLILAGGVNNPRQAAVYTASLPDADWTLTQLRISDEERNQRISHRARLNRSTTGGGGAAAGSMARPRCPQRATARRA